MMPDEQYFDEPQLKAALRRAMPDYIVPDRLRQQVLGFMLAAPPAPAPARSPWWQALQYGMLAAACLAIAVGIASVLAGIIPMPSFTSSKPAPAYANALPATTVTDMVATHDRCSRLADHHLLAGVSDDDFGAIGHTLQVQLNQPVVATPLGGSWTFRGAGICMVGPFRSAHLLFAHGDQTISIFSLPAGYECSPGVNNNYQSVVENHLVAGFARNGGLFCVVAHCPHGEMTMNDVVAMRDKIETNGSVSSCQNLLRVVASAR